MTGETEDRTDSVYDRMVYVYIRANPSLDFRPSRLGHVFMRRY